MSSSSLNINHNPRSTEFISQIYTNSNTNSNSNINTLYTNNTKQLIPKSQSTIKRCNSKPNFSNSEAKYDFFSSSSTDNQQIEFLKKSFKTRIVQLISNLQSCVSKLTPYNAADLINEQIFLEKENAIALLYEEMSSIKVDYEENKNEMDRLQKIISVLEIDLNKFDSKLNEMTQKNQSLQDDNSRLQAENFDYSLQLKNIQSANRNDDTEAINTIAVLKDNYNQMYNELHEAIIQAKQDGDNHVLLIQKEYQKKTNELEQELFKLRNALNDHKDTIQKKNSQINKLLYNNDDFFKSKEANERTIQMLYAKIESIKCDYNDMANKTKEDIKRYKADIKTMMEQIVNAIYNNASNETIEDNDRLKQEEEKNGKLMRENYKLSDQCQKLNESNKKHQMQISTLNNKVNEYECESEVANGTIANLKIEIDALNDALSNKKLILQTYKKNAQISFDGIHNSIKDKINSIKTKYINEIAKLRYEVNDLLNKNNDYQSNEGNNISSLSGIQYNNQQLQSNTKIVSEYENTISKLKHNISSYEKALLKKEKKIRELKTALSQSFYSLSSGMNNIKIAHLLDNEVKQLMNKERSTPNKKYK